MRGTIRALLFGVFCLAAAACSNDAPAAREVVDTTTTAAPAIAEPMPIIDEAPSAPVGLAAGTAEGTVELTWDESRDDEVTGYRVIRVASTGASVSFDTSESNFADIDLNDGDIFTYTVVAVSDDDVSERSEAVSVQVGVDTNPPRRPGSPRAVESDEGVTIAWRPSSDFSGIDRYIVTRQLNGETTEIDTPEATLVDDIEPGQVVSYAVRAVDGEGNESENSRNVTLLSGTVNDEVVVVVSAVADPADDPLTQRLQESLLDQGFVVSWFEDDVFDSNVTTSDDLVLLVGDIVGQGFDWNLFGTDAHTIALKSIFLEASGLTIGLPKLDGLAQLDYTPPGGEVREVAMTTVERPRNVVIIPAIEQVPDLQVWATPTWTDEIAVAGLIPEGGELATDDEAPGCRAFFPGNADSLSEQTDAAWDLLIEFVDSVSTACR